MREIKYRAEHNGKVYEVETVIPKRKDHKGYYKMHGYILRRVNNHPFANKRGYVPEHRLIMEQHLKRFLEPRKELVHHIDGNRSNNEISNLKLTTPKEHFYEEHFKARNPNGQFVAIDPTFGEIKYRLYDRDKNITQIYTLRELISKTFRRAKFEFRGRFTGLKDKDGKEVYEGDIVKHRYHDDLQEILWDERILGYKLLPSESVLQKVDEDRGLFEIIGNRFEHPHLLEGFK